MTKQEEKNLMTQKSLLLRELKQVSSISMIRLLLERAFDFLQQAGSLGFEVLRYLG